MCVRGEGRKERGEGGGTRGGGKEGEGEEGGKVRTLSVCTHLHLSHVNPPFLLRQGYVFSSSLMYWLVRHLRCKKQPRNRYKHILADIEPMWPPVEVEGDNRGIQSAC